MRAISGLYSYMTGAAEEENVSTASSLKSQEMVSGNTRSSPNKSDEYG